MSDFVGQRGIKLKELSRRGDGDLKKFAVFVSSVQEGTGKRRKHNDHINPSPRADLLQHRQRIELRSSPHRSPPVPSEQTY